MLHCTTTKANDYKSKDDVGGAGCIKQKVLADGNQVSRQCSKIKQTFPGVAQIGKGKRFAAWGEN